MLYWNQYGAQDWFQNGRQNACIFHAIYTINNLTKEHSLTFLECDEK